MAHALISFPILTIVEGYDMEMTFPSKVSLSLHEIFFQQRFFGWQDLRCEAFDSHPFTEVFVRAKFLFALLLL
jgi:hypothetical protein